MNSWTLLRLNPQTQSRYVGHVVDNIPHVELYYPMYERITRPHGKRQPMVVWMPVYPGYVFARLDMDGDGIHELVTCPVKARFIKFGGEISTIPDKVIHELRRLESLSMLVREVQRVNPYRPGVKVRVHTPVADIQAVIVALIRGNRLKVDSCIGTITVPVHKVNLL